MYIAQERFSPCIETLEMIHCKFFYYFSDKIFSSSSNLVFLDLCFVFFLLRLSRYSACYGRLLVVSVTCLIVW